MMSDEPGRLAMMLGVVETSIDSIIDAMSLSELINLKKDRDILQANCNNYCARLAQDCIE